MTAQEKVIAIAVNEDGYLEKKSNSNLDSPSANAGSANYTKYARDLDNLGVYNGPKNGYAWCDVFVDWCFVQAFGLELALRMTFQAKGGYGAGCTESARYYKERDAFHKTSPKVGDQIFFTNDGGNTMYHTGLVIKVDTKKVYTIEGNTSSAAGVVANGGCVRQKSYSLTYNQIGGYGTPDYSLYKVETEETEMVEKKTVAIDGKNYTCGVIMKAGENYVRLRDFIQAGYGITYDAKTQVPGILAPQTRTSADDTEVQEAAKVVQEAYKFEDQTMEYLLRYKYGNELILRLKEAVK